MLNRYSSMSQSASRSATAQSGQTGINTELVQTVYATDSTTIQALLLLEELLAVQLETRFRVHQMATGLRAQSLVPPLALPWPRTLRATSRDHRDTSAIDNFVRTATDTSVNTA